MLRKVTKCYNNRYKNNFLKQTLKQPLKQTKNSAAIATNRLSPMNNAHE